MPAWEGILSYLFLTLQGIGALENSAKSGSLVDAKRSFVTAVSALQTWADDAGIAASLKGLWRGTWIWLAPEKAGLWRED